MVSGVLGFPANQKAINAIRNAFSQRPAITCHYGQPCSLGFGYRLGEGFLHLVGIRHYARRSQFIRERTLAHRPAPVNARLCSALESGLEVAYRVSSVVLTAEDIQLSFRN